MYAIRYDHLRTAMPACLIDHQYDTFSRSCTNSSGQFSQCCAPNGGADGRQQEPKGLPRVWADKAIQIRPFIAVLDDHDGTLAFFAPHTAQDRFQPDPVFIMPPHLDGGGGIGRVERVQSIRKRFF